MIFKQFTINPFAENTYIISSGSKAILIDPGFFDKHEQKQLSNHLKDEELSLSAVVLTHAHLDHVLGIPHIVEKYNVPVYMNHKDLYLWKNVSKQGAMFGVPFNDFEFEPEEIPAEGELKIQGFEFQSLYTPGHAPDHASFYFPDEGKLIAGDTLFKGSIGRTDLYKGDFSQLENSIKTKLYTLPGTTEVLPGHGPKTTIEEEKKSNDWHLI